MTDYAQMQREIYEAGERAEEEFRKEGRALFEPNLIDGVDSSFLPLDLLTEAENPDFSRSALETRTKIDLLKSYIDDVSKAEIEARKDSFLTRQAYEADLISIHRQLNNIVARWDTKRMYESITARARISELATNIGKRIQVDL